MSRQGCLDASPYNRPGAPAPAHLAAALTRLYSWHHAQTLRLVGHHRHRLQPANASFVDLAENLKIDVRGLRMKECNGHASPSRALVKGLARELDLSESMLDRLAEEVREDLRAK